ncbi:hypothetical protein SS1G_08669 [Sclerotinia sclerotiorum 1980 UF-70]|uniref:Uncharacterized protein n=1 Tax=Sclerotinia sclerotiorum (strain ATCC 18683 / 1980 / Ss-1) TaxID=665079 RepID=A7ETL3_SCLS1|nr:hypothetical protein SS1G_08669 [Sclerotinia sclerotiorum 1980 UF-70]EDN92805.1 hypothetical protein SS1G_08669 [Sclerotinia sclerotiorum 1980 UF-70]
MNSPLLGFLSTILVLQPYFNAVEADSYPLHPPDAVDKLATKGLAKLAAYQAMHDPNDTCTVKTAIKRREW